MSHILSNTAVNSVQCPPQPTSALTLPSTPVQVGVNSSAQALEDSGVPTVAAEGISSALNPPLLVGTSCGASDIYWSRLQALLVEANTKLSSLRPAPTGTGTYSGVRNIAAALFQGLSPANVEASLLSMANSSAVSEFRMLLETNAAGQYVDYGVQEAHASWVLLSLQKVCPDKVPKNIDVLWTRVRVFEAEVACLPVEIVDKLLAARKSMHKVHVRIDTCVRILMAMEGRGRKLQHATLDKLKASLEKAELQAQAEARKIAEREREREERRVCASQASTPTHGLSQTSGSCTPISSRKATREGKRRRERAQQTAQASFMMRFVRSKASDNRERSQVGTDSDVQKGSVALMGNDEAKRRLDGLYAVNFAGDLDVMSASWWLLSQIPSVGYTAIHSAIRNQTSFISNSSELRKNLLSLKQCRLSVGSNVRRAMRDFRRGRRDHTTDRNPQLLGQRRYARYCHQGVPVKLLQFAENHRPAYYGIYSKRSLIVNGRKPFVKDSALDYDHDSDQEWDEDDDGEDLSDMEAETERVTEDAELRKLYGSDEEEDDDFLDDEEIEDGDDSDDETGDGEETRAPVCQKSGDDNGDVILDNDSRNKLVGMLPTPVPTALEEKEKDITPGDYDKRRASEDLRRAGKRRKLNSRQNVIIVGPSPPTEAVNYQLDRFPVTVVEGANSVPMFNPFVFDIAHLEAEHLKARSGPSKGSRVAMDDRARKELAVVVEKGSKDGFTRDRIVAEFCSVLKASGLDTPSKTEIVRAIGDIATFEKRDGDARAGWHLNTNALRLTADSG